MADKPVTGWALRRKSDGRYFSWDRGGTWVEHPKPWDLDRRKSDVRPPDGNEEVRCEVTVRVVEKGVKRGQGGP